MADLSSAQLDLLRAQRDATTDSALRAALDAAIAALQAQQTTESLHMGNIDQATSVAIGDTAQSTVTTMTSDSGDVAGGAIDKRSGSFVEGNQYNLTLFFTTAGIAKPSDEQRELVEAYLARLAQRCDRLRISGTVRRERRESSQKPLTLSQVYVTLASTQWQTIREADYEQDFAKDIKNGNPDIALPEAVRQVVEVVYESEDFVSTRRDTTLRYCLQRPILLTEAMCQHKQIVLLGGPGSGKSSFLRYLAVALAQPNTHPLPTGWSAGRLLPIYASLGTFAAWTQRQKKNLLNGSGLWHYLVEIAQDYGLKGLGKQLERALREGGLLILLDGLDEVADPNVRIHVAQAVAALAEMSSYLVVTCRVRSFEGTVAAPFATWGDAVHLAPFSLGQMRHFVQAWYTRSVEHAVITHDEAQQRAQELNERLGLLPTLRDLGQTPLLLTIITILHFYEGKLPEDRADLYEDLVQLMLTRWTQQRREVGAPLSLIDALKADKMLGGLKEFHLRNTLEQLAFQAHQQNPGSDGRGLLDRHRVRGTFEDLFREFELGPGPAAEKTHQVLTYLEQESGLLLPEGGDLYGLPHLSYEEYLACCYLSRQPDFQQRAYQLWQQDASRWREVIFLALGRMVRGEGRETAAGWLRFLLEPNHGQQLREQVERERATFFAYECLDEMGGKEALIGVRTVPLPTLWDSLAASLAQVVEGTTLPAAERVQAGRWLGVLGDPRPGVCTLPPVMVKFSSGSVVIGMDDAELKRLPKEEQDDFYDTRNERPTPLVAFALARYPVTNVQYQRFMEADGYNTQASWWDDAGRTWLHQSGKKEPRSWENDRFGIDCPNHPVIGISWYEAMAFCRWLTVRLNDGYIYTLPSEAEWEYAARGTDRRLYPWGNEAPDAEWANYDGNHDGTSAVGCFPAGATPEGLLDMAGNVWEWTRSAYRDYPYNPNDGREDSRQPAEERFTLRGGSWLGRSISLRAAYRNHDTPDYHFDDVGFRVARHPQPIADS